MSPARGRAAPPAAELPEVGHDPAAFAPVDREPGAAGLDVAAADDVRRIRPRRERRGGTLVEFVAIGGGDEPVAGMGTPREN